MITTATRTIKCVRRRYMYCRECGNLREHYGRELCRWCSQKPDVRERHPQNRKQRVLDWGASCREMVLPDPPYPMHTDDRERRITVMRRRALAGYGVFHPDDSKSPDWRWWMDSINPQMDEAHDGDD